MPEEGIRIVSVGLDAESAWLRDAVLISAGFQVFSTSQGKVALKKIERRECDVLLLYYRLPDSTVEHLVEAFRRRCRKGKIVVISGAAIEKPEFADRLLFRVEGTEALIDVLHGE